MTGHDWKPLNSIHSWCTRCGTVLVERLGDVVDDYHLVPGVEGKHADVGCIAVDERRGQRLSVKIELVVRMRLASMLPWEWARKRVAESLFRCWEYVPWTCEVFDGIYVIMRDGRGARWHTMLQDPNLWRMS